jgi:hypothetical protein
MQISLETLAAKGFGDEVVDRISALKDSTEATGLYMPEGELYYPARIEWEGGQLMAQPLLFLHCVTKRTSVDPSEIFRIILESGFEMSETTKATKKMDNVYVAAQDLSGQAYDVYWARRSLREETKYDRFILEIAKGELAPWMIEKRGFLFHLGDFQGAGLLLAPADAITGVIAVPDALSEEQFSKRQAHYAKLLSGMDYRIVRRHFED